MKIVKRYRLSMKKLINNTGKLRTIVTIKPLLIISFCHNLGENIAYYQNKNNLCIKQRLIKNILM